MKKKHREIGVGAAVVTHDSEGNGGAHQSKKKRGKHNKVSEAIATNGGNGDHAQISTAIEVGEEEARSKKGKLSRKEYEKEMLRLQGEMCVLQDWVKETGKRIIIVFEGRDAAGKGGMIRALTERVSPRVFRVVALPAPSDRQKSQLYVQRYLQHFPAAGEVVIFDRSWYNRAGVERVMGFVSKDKYEKFLRMCPRFEKVILEEGIILIKYWLEVSDDEQKRRFEARISDPMRKWKLSAMDLPSRERWFEYSRARDAMLEATDTDESQWHIVNSNSKRRARLNLMSHLLRIIPYEEVKRDPVKLPHRSKKNEYDDETPMKNRRWIPDVTN
jgi:polyphosphate kinase